MLLEIGRLPTKPHQYMFELSPESLVKIYRPLPDLKVEGARSEMDHNYLDFMRFLENFAKS